MNELKKEMPTVYVYKYVLDWIRC